MLRAVSGVAPIPVHHERELFGRREAFDAWDALRAAGVRRVTVVGPPGVGKSAFVASLAALEGVPVAEADADAPLVIVDDADGLSPARLEPLTGVLLAAARRPLRLRGEHLI